MLVAVVDDSLQDAQMLEQYFRQYSQEIREEFQTTHFGSARDFLAYSGEKFDLVVMDIDMPGINGVEAARQLRERGDGTVLMFVTNMPQYALAGYEVEAMDYVLKPLSYADFAFKLRKARRYILNHRDDLAVLRTRDGIETLPVSSILYVESSLHYLTYHLADREIQVRGSMREAESQLPENQFCRCNSGYLVNLRHVKSIEKENVYVGNIPLKLSRGQRLECMERITRYLGGMK